MSPRRTLLSVALIALGLLSACALRPRYRDVVQPEGASPQVVEGQILQMRIVDPSTGQPIPGAKVFAGTGRSRLAATSGAEGELSVPVSQALINENPLVEVVLPKGVRSYQFQVLRPTEPPAAEPTPAEPPAEPPAAQPAEAPEETNSTGSIAPASPAAPDTPPAPPPSSPNGQN